MEHPSLVEWRREKAQMKKKNTECIQRSHKLLCKVIWLPRMDDSKVTFLWALVMLLHLKLSMTLRTFAFQHFWQKRLENKMIV